jgi:hypothetical protein
MKLKMLRVVLMTIVMQKVVKEEPVNQPGTAPFFVIPTQTQFLTVDGKMKKCNEHYLF